MADSAARAEARRRRILQNSQSRLQRITGRIDETVPSNGASIKGYEEQRDCDNSYVPPVLYNDITDDASIFTDNGFISQDFMPNVYEHPTPLPPESANKDELSERTSKIDFICNLKLHIILLSLLVQFIYSMNNEISSYIFLPLLILEITEMVCLEPVKKNVMLSAVLSMSGIGSKRIDFLLKFTQAVSKFLEDACIYIFFIVFTQSLLTAVL